MDENENPIQLKAYPIKPEISIRGRKQIINAVSERTVILQRNQRLSSTYYLDEKLKTGYYSASIYSDKGLLGVSNFRIR